MADNKETVFAFTLPGLQKLLAKLEAARKMSEALKEVSPLVHGMEMVHTEQKVLEALADWEAAQ